MCLLALSAILRLLSPAEFQPVLLLSRGEAGVLTRPPVAAKAQVPLITLTTPRA